MKKSDTREKFIVYIEELDILDSISDEDMGKLIRAMAKYVKTGEEAAVPQHLLFAFKFIISHIDRDVEKYNSVIEKRVAAGKKSAACRWGNGDAKELEVESASSPQNKENGNKPQNKNTSVEDLSQSIQKTTTVAENEAREEKTSDTVSSEKTSKKSTSGVESLRYDNEATTVADNKAREEKTSDTVSSEKTSKKSTSGVESLRYDNEATTVAENKAREEKEPFMVGNYAKKEKTSSCVVTDSREESLSYAVENQSREESLSCAVGKQSGEESLSYAVEKQSGEESLSCAVGKQSGEESLSCAVGKQSREERPLLNVESDSMEEKTSCVTEDCAREEKIFSAVRKNSMENENSFKTLASVAEGPLKKQKYNNDFSAENMRISSEKNSKINEEDIQWIPGSASPWGDSDEFVSGYVIDNESNSLKFVRRRVSAPQKEVSLEDALADEKLRIEQQNRLKSNIIASPASFDEALTDTRSFSDVECEGEPQEFSASIKGDNKTEYHEGHIPQNAKSSYENMPQNASSPYENMPQNAKSPYENMSQNASSPYENMSQNASLSCGSVPQNAKSSYENMPQNASSPYENMPQNAKSSYENMSQNASSSYGSMPQNASPPYENIPQKASSSYGNRKSAVLPFAKKENSGGGMVKLGNVIEVKEKPLSNELIKDDLQMFEEFWESYPKKINQKQAKFEFLKAEIDRETHKKILSSIERMKKTDEWRREGGRFIPYPHRYISGRRWEDDFEANNNDFTSFDTDEFFEAALRKSSESYT